MEHEVILSDEDLDFLIIMCAAYSLTLSPATYKWIKVRCLKRFFETIRHGKGEEDEKKL